MAKALKSRFALSPDSKSFKFSVLVLYNCILDFCTIDWCLCDSFALRWLCVLQWIFYWSILDKDWSS